MTFKEEVKFMWDDIFSEMTTFKKIMFWFFISWVLSIPICWVIWNVKLAMINFVILVITYPEYVRHFIDTDWKKNEA